MHHMYITANNKICCNRHVSQCSRPAFASKGLIAEYLGTASHSEDLEGALFRPVKNNTTGDLTKSLNPRSVYRDVVIFYAKQVGITLDTHGVQDL